MNLKKLLTGNSRLSEIVRFALVGGLATVLQYGFYIIFVHAVGVPAVPSTMISYALSFIVNYILSSYVTFHTKPSAILSTWVCRRVSWLFSRRLSARPSPFFRPWPSASR